MRIQLGTSTNNAANYCLVYNYYSGSNATSCAIPTQGTGNNGNVMGYLYQDSVSSSLQHQVSNTYDALSRLTNSTATPVSPGTVNYNLSYSADRFGNVTCTGGTGLCTQLGYNPATNHITDTGYSYDQAGEVVTDGTGVGANTYTWDAEGRLTAVQQGRADRRDLRL